MAKTIIRNARVFAGAVDLTAVGNRVEFSPSADVKDVTTFGSVDAAGTLWRDNMATLFSSSVMTSGFWEAGSGSFVDDETWAQFGGVGPWTIVPGDGAVEGTTAYLVGALRNTYTLGGAVGDVAPFSSGSVGSGPFARGAILLNPATARTATGTGGVVQLGAVPAGRSMRAALHVVSIAGTTPTFTAVLQSATVVGFGSPTTRATFTVVNGAAGTRTSEFVSSAVGPITDQFWRISYTITGTTPSYLVAASAGIG